MLKPISDIINDFERLTDPLDFFWNDTQLTILTAKCSNKTICIQIAADAFPNINSSYSHGDIISILHPDNLIGASKLGTVATLPSVHASLSLPCTQSICASSAVGHMCARCRTVACGC